MARENTHFQQHTWVCFAFKHLLQCSDDRSLPLVTKIRDLMGFRATNCLRVDKVWTAACFSVLPLLRIMKRVAKGHTITAKKKKKLMNSHQKTQEYIKGKSPLFYFIGKK